MKKQIMLAATVVLSAAVLVINGCKKEDTTGPVVTLNGASSVKSPLNTAWVDPGATAKDENDKDPLTVKANGAVNKDLAGTYTVTYTANDAAGNAGTATRLVTVYNEAEAWAGVYDGKNILDSVFSDSQYKTFLFLESWVDKSLGATPYPLSKLTISASTSVNNKIIFDRFSNYSKYAPNELIYGTVQPNGIDIIIPLQTANGIGIDDKGKPKNETHTFQGKGYKIATTTGFKFKLYSSDLNKTSPSTYYDAVSFTR